MHNTISVHEKFQPRQLNAVTNICQLKNLIGSKWNPYDGPVGQGPDTNGTTASIFLGGTLLRHSTRPHKHLSSYIDLESVTYINYEVLPISDSHQPRALDLKPSE